MSKVQSFDCRRTRKILYVMLVIVTVSIVGACYFSYQSTQVLSAIFQISTLDSEVEQLQYGLLVDASKLALFNMALMVVTSLLAIISIFTTVKLLTSVESFAHTEITVRLEAEEAHVEEVTAVKTSAVNKQAEQPFVASQDSPQSASRLYSSEDTILDINSILESMDGDKESAVMLLEIFRDEYSAYGLRLRELIEGSQTEEALRLVHNLKEVAGSLGAPRLKIESERLEKSYQQQEPVTVNDAEKLTEIIYLVVNAINEYLIVGIKNSSDVAAPLNIEAKKISSIIDASNKANEALRNTELSVTDTDKEPISPELTTKAAIDIPLMLEAMDGDSDSVQMLLDIFMDEHAADAEKLHCLVSQCEPSNISEPAIRIVHSLKGVAGSLGAEKLKVIAGDIEIKFIQHRVVSEADYRALSLALDECVTYAMSYISEEANVHA
ncbi:Hpt domain-containing protein [Photobacterium profundum]|uniref:Hpt domain-containing protein n=1 Tax=Photobacterium profundum TaxID=74109 RepID=UPI003D128348